MSEFVNNLKKELEKKGMDSDFLNNIDSEITNLENTKELSLTKQEEKPKNFLNEDQNRGLQAILDWAYTYKGQRNPDNQFSLRGSAGTGKTTLINQLLKDIDKSKYSSGRICVCAPTHKAKKVITVKTKWPNTDTLQSMLGLRPDTNIEDFDPNKPEFAETGVRKIDDFYLVIIDECSMINAKLYELLSKSKAMILFIGDHKQLKPVKEVAISLALSNPIHSYTLTQPARQRIGNPLLDLLNIISEDIDNNTDVFLDILKGGNMINEIEEGYEVINTSDKFGEKMKGEFTKEDFIQDRNYCRYIAFTNDSITKTNRWIRQNIFSNSGTMANDEILLSYRTVREEKSGEAVIVNSDDYLIKKVSDEIIIDTYSSDIPLKVFSVEIECIDNGEESEILVLKRDKENYDNYVKIYDDYLTQAKVKKGSYWTKVFYPFKNHILVPDKIEYVGQLGTKEVISKDIDYGYGITCHKSQGSTYNNVFVNFQDISVIIGNARTSKELEDAKLMRRNLVYVALSRASRKAYIRI